LAKPPHPTTCGWAAAAGLTWPDIVDWDEERLRTALAPSSIPAPNWRKTDDPDYAAIRRELQPHKHLTLQLLWQEYREQRPNGYGYSRYCGLYRSWLKRQDVVLRHEHRAGEKLFVDYAGDAIPVHDPATGEVSPAAVFVAVLGASRYTYAEATDDNLATNKRRCRKNARPAPDRSQVFHVGRILAGERGPD
jgi:transposase